MSTKINTKNKVSSQFIAEFEKCFNVLNAKLFNNQIPACMITLNRNRLVADGMFILNSFHDSQDSDVQLSEICINSDNFANHDAMHVLSVIAHEMCHYKDCLMALEKGDKPARTNYHTQRFADIMLSIGLQTSDTGYEGGAHKGQTMSQYVIEGGKFEAVAQKIIDDGFAIKWHSLCQNPVKPKKAGKKKVKYMCQCEVAVWADKPVNLMCADCNTSLQKQVK